MHSSKREKKQQQLALKQSKELYALQRRFWAAWMGKSEQPAHPEAEQIYASVASGESHKSLHIVSRSSRSSRRERRYEWLYGMLLFLAGKRVAYAVEHMQVQQSIPEVTATPSPHHAGVTFPHAFPWPGDPHLFDAQEERHPVEDKAGKASSSSRQKGATLPPEISQFLSVQEQAGLSALRHIEGQFYDEDSLLNTVRKDVYGAMKQHHSYDIPLLEYRLKVTLDPQGRTFSLLTLSSKQQALSDNVKTFANNVEKVINQFNNQYDDLVKEKSRDSEIAYIEMLCWRISTYIRSFEEFHYFMFDHDTQLIEGMVVRGAWQENTAMLHKVTTKYQRIPSEALTETLLDSIHILESLSHPVHLARRNDHKKSEDILLSLGKITVRIGRNNRVGVEMRTEDYLNEGITPDYLKMVRVESALRDVLTNFITLFNALPQARKTRANYIDMILLEMQEIVSCFPDLPDVATQSKGFPESFLLDTKYRRYTKEQVRQEHAPFMDPESFVNVERVRLLMAMDKGALIEVPIEGRMLRIEKKGNTTFATVNAVPGTQQDRRPFPGNGTLKRIVDVFHMQYENDASEETRTYTHSYVDLLLQRIKMFIRTYPGWERFHYEFEYNALKRAASASKWSEESPGAEAILNRYDGMNSAALEAHFSERLRHVNEAEMPAPFPTEGSVSIGPAMFNFQDDNIVGVGVDFGKIPVFGDREAREYKIYSGIYQIYSSFSQHVTHMSWHLQSIDAARKLCFPHILEYVRAFKGMENATFIYETPPVKHSSPEGKPGEEMPLWLMVAIGMWSCLVVGMMLFARVRSYTNRIDSKNREKQRQDILDAYLNGCIEVVEEGKDALKISIGRYLEFSQSDERIFESGVKADCTLSRTAYEQWRNVLSVKPAKIIEQRQKALQPVKVTLEGSLVSKLIARIAATPAFITDEYAIAKKLWGRWRGYERDATLFTEEAINDLHAELQKLPISHAVKSQWSKLWYESPEGKAYLLKRQKEEADRQRLLKEEAKLVARRGIATSLLNNMNSEHWKQIAKSIKEHIQRIEELLAEDAKHRKSEHYATLRPSASLTEERVASALETVKTMLHVTNSALETLELSSERAAYAEKRFKPCNKQEDLRVYEAELLVYEKYTKEMQVADKTLRSTEKALENERSYLAAKLNQQSNAFRKIFVPPVQTETPPVSEWEIEIGLSNLFERAEQLYQRSEWQKKQKLLREQKRMAVSEAPADTVVAHPIVTPESKKFLPAKKEYVAEYKAENGINLLKEATLHCQKLSALQSLSSVSKDNNNSNNADSVPEAALNEIVHYATLKHIGQWLQALYACPASFGISNVMSHMEMARVRHAIYHYAILQGHPKDTEDIRDVLLTYVGPVVHHLTESGGIAGDGKLKKIDYTNHTMLYALTRVEKTKDTKKTAAYSSEACLAHMQRCLKVIETMAEHKTHPFYKDAVEMVMSEIGIYAKECRHYHLKDAGGNALYYQLPYEIRDCMRIRRTSGHDFRQISDTEVQNMQTLLPRCRERLGMLSKDLKDLEEASTKREAEKHAPSNDNTASPGAFVRAEQERDTGKGMRPYVS